MRIAVLCTDQGVRVPGTKGASLHLLAITRAFAQLGHDVLLLGVAGHEPAPADLRTWLVAHPGRAEGVERERRKLALTERVAVEAGPVLEDFGPDVLYERLALFGTAGARLATRTGAAHVVEVNALISREEAQWRGLTHTRLAAQRETQVLSSADRVITVSAQWEHAVRSVLTGRTDVRTVPNGVDESAFQPVVSALGHPRRRAALRRATRAAYRLPQQARLVVFTGTVRPWHGVDLAVRALARTPADVHLVVVGDGEPGDLPALAGLAADLAVTERVHLLGRVPHRQVPALLAAADVGIAPYPQLPDFAFSPLKLYEYLAAGLPFVAADLGQLREVAGRVGTGVLAPPGDVAALADATIGALADPTLGHRARRFAPGALAEFGWRARAADILRDLPTGELPCRSA